MSSPSPGPLYGEEKDSLFSSEEADGKSKHHRFFLNYLKIIFFVNHNVSFVMSNLLLDF